MDAKRKRLGILLALLIASVAVLFQDPAEQILTETHWKQMSPPGDRSCSQVSPEHVRFSVQLNHEVDDDLSELASQTRWFLRTQCGDNCLVSAKATVHVQAVEWPSFFSGHGYMECAIALQRSGKNCHDTTHHTVQITVDQGRRGSIQRQLREAGRILAIGLAQRAAQSSKRAAHR